MQKLKLNFDELKVESFTTNIERTPKGKALGAATNAVVEHTCIDEHCGGIFFAFILNNCKINDPVTFSKLYH